MIFTTYLKGQLNDFVESYKKYFYQTFETALIYTIFCFVISALLLSFSEFDKSNINKQISLLSYFFHRYSKADTYSLVDNIKSVFLYFVSFFSVGLLRFDSKNGEKFSIARSVKLIHFKDVLYLTSILLISAFIDYVLFKTEHYSYSLIAYLSLGKYLRDILFQLRIYIPLFLFSLTIRSIITTSIDRAKLTLKAIVFLYTSLWLFNEVAYEISIWIRAQLFALFLLPFSESEKYYLYESLLGIPLIAFYFLGYFSAMTFFVNTTRRQIVSVP